MTAPLSLRLIPAVAYRAWFTPPPLGRRAARRDAEAVAGLERFTADLGEGLTLSGYEAGEGPVALVLHGWGGRSAQMSEVVRRLAALGMRAVAPDLPGRAGGARADLREAAAAVCALAGVLGPPRVVVAHSFAALMLRAVAWEATPPLVVMAAPVVNVSDALDRFTEQLALAPWTARALRRRLATWDPKLFGLVDGPHPEQLPGADVLILHDPGDDETSFASAAELATLRPGTRLVPVPGSGHNGILRHPGALDELADFTAGREGRAPSQRVKV